MSCARPWGLASVFGQGWSDPLEWWGKWQCSARRGQHWLDGQWPIVERLVATLHRKCVSSVVLSSSPVGGSSSPTKSTVTRYVSARSSAYVRSGRGGGYRVIDTERRGTDVPGSLVNGWLKVGSNRCMGPGVLWSRSV